jgi:hypothetical protein
MPTRGLPFYSAFAIIAIVGVVGFLIYMSSDM